MGITIYPHEIAVGSQGVREEPLPPVYILVVPNNEGPLFETLQQFLAAAAGYSPVVPSNFTKATLEGVDSWLENRAAAEYLGVGRSTLDRYAEGEQIESLKFGGRLEYRSSSLDEFKARHVHPARRSHRECSVILSASHYRFEIDTFAKLKVARSLGLMCDGFDSMPPTAC
jgi:hypothetical protein